MRLVAAAIGLALFVHLVERTGPGTLLENVKTIGWGMVPVIALAGVSHVIRTWAWRLALLGESQKVPFSRTLGLRLVSEATGQFGLLGQVFGETTRVSLLGSGVPVASGISSVTLDRGLFMVTGAVVTIAGLLAATVVISLSRVLHFYAALFSIVLLALLVTMVVAFRNRWPLFSGTARAAGRVPWCREWLQSKESVIVSAEHQLLKFHREAPRAFFGCLFLNVVCHLLAILEVYLILHLLGTHVSFLGALILESLTKLINVIGAVNPGNIGTYEGGNMAIGKLLGLTSAQGLTLGLCRRLRAIFWAVVGGICLGWFSRSNQNADKGGKAQIKADERDMSTQEHRQQGSQFQSYSQVAIVLANLVRSDDVSKSVLSQVGALPLLLRAILGAQSAGADRIIVVVNRDSGLGIRSSLVRTGRLPAFVEWVAVACRGASLPTLVAQVAPTANRITFVMADRAYHPSLHRMIGEWDGKSGALELITADQPVGLAALSRGLALELASDSDAEVFTLDDLYEWIARRDAFGSVPTLLVSNSVSEDFWQCIATPEDRAAAERKLDRWLVKPTDGIFAKMNRRISIPISRQLIRFPITPNMVSLFTLGVSVSAAVFFALGGYWNTVVGALLSVWASILDGCDGEVARLKLQASAFGCWLETVCDYLYYLVIFVGMTIGLARSTGDGVYLMWGATLLFGAIATIVFACLGRQRLSGERPEQYLAAWQAEAASRRSNPILRLGRYTEFMARRCFLPYAILVFALLNLTDVVLYLAAVGANVAWIISLYSYVSFPRRAPGRGVLSTSASPAKPLTLTALPVEVRQPEGYRARVP